MSVLSRPSRGVAAARRAMGDEAFLTARDAGAALSYQDAGELACELTPRRPGVGFVKPFPRIARETATVSVAVRSRRELRAGFRREHGSPSARRASSHPR